MKAVGALALVATLARVEATGLAGVTCTYDPIDCELYTAVSDTSLWSACADDGTGKYYRTKVLGIKVEPAYGGKPCPAEDDPVRKIKELCNPSDCVALTPAEDTGPFGACEDRDGSGKYYKYKTLGVKTPASNGGSCDPKLREYKEPCEAVDCVVKTPAEDTGSFGDCIDKDGSGVYYRYKVLGIKTPAANGGAACPPEDSPLREAKELCAAVDCVPFTSAEDTTTPFGNCTDRDGTNVWYQYRTLAVKTPASNGGKCDPKDREDKKLCPAENCVAFTPEEDTGDYGPCTLVNGKYVKSKTLGVKVDAKYGGKCDPADRQFSQPCAAIDCVLYTEAEDPGPYGNCTDRDGSNVYYQYKILGIKSEAQYGGTECPAEDNPIREVKKLCQAVDCVPLTPAEDTTTPFGDCTQVNGTNVWYQYRTLGIKTPASNGGKCDPKDRQDQKLCEGVPCVINTPAEDTGNFTDCIPEVGSYSGKYYKYKVLGIKTPAQYGGSCPTVDDPVREYKEFCPPENCIPFTPEEDTGDYGNCTKNATDGKFYKSKTLGVKVEAKYGGLCDPADRQFSQPCAAIDCVLYTEAEDPGAYGNCTDRDGSNVYYQYKILGIKSEAQFGGTDCPAEDNPIREVKKLCDPVDCVPFTPAEDTTTPFGDCTQVNGTNVWYQNRTLAIKTPASNGGKCDPKDRQDQKLCPAVPCVINTPAEDTGNFTDCMPEIGSYSGKYYKYKVLGVKTPAQYGGSCPTVDDPVREYKEFCPPENCIPFTPEEDTGDYGNCTKNATDGKYYKSKTLGVKVDAKYGGLCDPADRQFSQPCAAIDCVLYTEAEDPGPYGNCTDRDGSNVYYRYKILGIKSEAQYGGTDCPAVDNPIREVKQFCEPVDCVALLPSEDTTTPFGDCTQVNGTNVWYQNRTLAIKTPASNGGKCDPKDRQDQKLCPAVPCVINTPEEDKGNFTDCIPEVGSYSGKYYKYKVLGVKTPAQYGGSCPTVDDPVREYKEFCPPVKCVPYTPEEDIGDYGNCTKNATDGKYYKSKTLGVKIPAKYGGTCDPAERQFSQPCAAIDCVLYTEAEDPGAYGNCTDRNGTNVYYQYKILGIKSPALYGGVDCPAVDNPIREVKKFCPPVNCVPLTPAEDTTTPFGNCTDRNGTNVWYQYRTLAVKTPASNGGKCDPKDREDKKLCPAVPCVINTPAEDKGNFSECKLDSSSYSGKYYKSKVLGIKTPAQFGGSCPSTTDPVRQYKELCPPENCIPLTPAEDKGPFGPCTKNATDGKYYKTKTLGIKVDAKYGGTCDTKSRQYSELCPPVNCVVNTPDEDKGEFSKCKLINGQYYKTKVLGIKTPAQYGGTCPSEVDRTIKQLCPNDGWCLPSDDFYDICIPKLAQCGYKNTNFIYSGNTISETTGIPLWQCCDKCATTAGCVAYTFLPNDNPKKTECYLKWEIDDIEYVYGSVVSSVPKTPKPATCEYHDDRTLVSLTAKTLGEFNSDDLDFCCSKCKATRGCKAFIVDDGVCTLKSSEGTRFLWFGSRVGYV